MRATWLTRLTSGVIFGGIAGWAVTGWVTARAASVAPSALVGGLVFAAFLGLVLLCVFGLPLFREMRAEQKACGLWPLGALDEAGDVRRFHLPLGGRMAVWFFAVGATGTLTFAALR